MGETTGITQTRAKKGLDQDREMALTELMKQVDLPIPDQEARPGWIISPDPNLPAKQPFSVSPSPQVDTRTKTSHSFPKHRKQDAPWGPGQMPSCLQGGLVWGQSRESAQGFLVPPAGFK